MERRGTVFICPVDPVPSDGSMIDPATARMWATWQDEDAEGAVEDVELDGAEAAIAWGRERSEIVLIRLGHRGDTYFSAGARHEGDGENETFRRWPPAGPPPGGWWEPATGHTDDADPAGKLGVVSAEVVDRDQERRFNSYLLGLVRASAHSPRDPDPEELARQLPALEAADRLHARLCDLVAVLPPEEIWEADWEWADEDWVRDAFEDAAAYARYRQFGEDSHIYLAEGYPVGLAYADTLRASAAGLVVTLMDLDEKARARVAAVADAIRSYEIVRRPLGGGPYRE